jgi:hypothetical protein
MIGKLLPTAAVRAYALAGLGALGLYAASEAAWWEPAPEARAKMDPSVRAGPGGWRSFTMWHTGYRGGK